MTPREMHCDLMRQGLMKMRAPKPKKQKSEPPIVACDRCMDWHRKGKHIKPEVKP